MESAQIWLSLITSFASAIGVLFLVYNHFRNPDIKSAARLDRIEAICPIKHASIDEWIKDIRDDMDKVNKSIMLIKENDIKHIEQEMRRMSDTQTRILTILEYKEGKNID